jgi:hypothetical protein
MTYEYDVPGPGHVVFVKKKSRRHLAARTASRVVGGHLLSPTSYLLCFCLLFASCFLMLNLKQRRARHQLLYLGTI